MFSTAKPDVANLSCSKENSWKGGRSYASPFSSLSVTETSKHPSSLLRLLTQLIITKTSNNLKLILLKTQTNLHPELQEQSPWTVSANNRAVILRNDLPSPTISIFLSSSRSAVKPSGASYKQMQQKKKTKGTINHHFNYFKAKNK